jgi:hypothetical protein
VSDPGRPFSELRDEGLLWLINVSVFHPRGFALAVHLDDFDNVTGWSLLGDGSEAWVMADGPENDALMRKAKAVLA